MPAHKKCLPALLKTVEKAGQIVLSGYQRQNKYQVFTKEDKSLLTEVDLKVDTFLRQELVQILDIPVITEETYHQTGGFHGVHWLVDPIDGTNNFVDRHDDFCVMVALMERREPVIGVVYVPVFHEMYYALKDEGAWLLNTAFDCLPKSSKVPQDVSALHQIQRLKRHDEGAIHDYVFARSYRDMKAKEKAFLSRIGIKRHVIYGSCGYKLCKIAEHKADLYINWKGLHYWDLAAPTLILHEAGGQSFTADGKPLDYSRADYFTEQAVIFMGEHAEVRKRIVKVFQSI